MDRIVVHRISVCVASRKMGKSDLLIHFLKLSNFKVILEKEEKERNGFLFFPFLGIKTIKRIVSRPEHS